MATFVISVLSPGRHLGFPEFITFAFHCVDWATFYAWTNFQVDICSLGRDMATFVIFLISLGRHLGFPEFHSLILHSIGLTEPLLISGQIFRSISIHSAEI